MTSKQWPDDAQDRIYSQCAEAITQAGPERESLFLARLALLLFEQVGCEDACRRAILGALQDVPRPSLSALQPAAAGVDKPAPSVV